MRRVFWKFFLIVWLTAVLSIAALVALSSVFQATPFSREVEQARIALALQVASTYLRNDDVAAARQFAAAAARATPAIALAITELPMPGCRETQTETGVEMASPTACYRVSVQGPEASGWSRIWPGFVPWATALLAAALAAFGLTRYLLRPVEQLREGLSALAHGQFDTRIAGRMGGRRDEIADLARDFDVSAARLDELRKGQQRLFHDVSHELRSPLSRLQAAIGVLQQNPAKVGSMLERMNREITRIDRLVGEILTLARLADRSRDGAAVQAIDIMDLLDAIVTDAAFEAQARGITITLAGAPSVVARVDGELIYRAFENVIRNAVKYTADRSEVRIGSELRGEVLQVTVTDQGPGIPAAEIDAVFEPFARGTTARGTGGFGLGLAIAKRALEFHGGRIAMARRESGGLAVLMEIPLGRPR